MSHSERWQAWQLKRRLKICLVVYWNEVNMFIELRENFSHENESITQGQEEHCS